MLSYESKFLRHMRNMGKAAEYFMFLNGKVRFWSVHVFLTKILGSKIRALLFLLIIFIQIEKKIPLRLTQIPWAVELSGKLLWFQRNRGHPKTVISFEQIITLLESHRLNAARKFFSFYVIGEMFRTNKLFVDSVANQLYFDR